MRISRRERPALNGVSVHARQLAAGAPRRVLEPARKLTAGLGVVLGVDLVASPLPRMEVVDDRVELAVPLRRVVLDRPD